MDLLVDMVCSRPRLRMLKVEADAYDLKQSAEKVENLKLWLSCRPDFRIQGREWVSGHYGRCSGFQLELRSIDRS